LKMEAICSPPKVGWISTDHGFISQKVYLFITTAVRTSNPTYVFYLISRYFFNCVLFSSEDKARQSYRNCKVKIHSFIHSFIHQWLYSPLLGPGLFSFVISFTHTVGLLGWVISPS
jgi:hypothetical protein